jgi:hypothetical protein
MIYIYLTAIRLTSCGSGTAHIYTQTVQQYSSHLHTKSTAVQLTFTHKEYSSTAHIYTQTVQQYSSHLHTNNTQNTENRTYITITKLNIHINKKLSNLGSVGHALSLPVIPWHLPYNLAKTRKRKKVQCAQSLQCCM